MNLRGTDLPCIKGKGKEERKRLRQIKSLLSYTFKLIQAPFQVWAIILCGNAKHLLTAIANTKCSDNETNATLIYLAKALSSTYSSTLTALGLLVVSIIVDLILSAWRRRDIRANMSAVSPQSTTHEQQGLRINTYNDFNINTDREATEPTQHPHSTSFLNNLTILM